MMDCASFENRLTELLDGQAAKASQQATLAELRRHVEACPECGGARALVEWAALPPAERDPVEVPPESYWEGFNASVVLRLDQDATGRPAGGWRRYVAAASVVVALFAGWILRGWLDPETGPEQPVVTVGEQSGDLNWSRLEEVIRQASPEELADALRGLPGIEASGWVASENGLGGDWIPTADELDGIDRSELMEWLDQLEQSQRRPTS